MQVHGRILQTIQSARFQKTHLNDYLARARYSKIVLWRGVYAFNGIGMARQTFGLPLRSATAQASDVPRRKIMQEVSKRVGTVHMIQAEFAWLWRSRLSV